MLKRSFAEFHAQKAQPEQLAELEAGRALAAAYAARPWPPCYVGCSRAEVEEYHEVCAAMEGLQEAVQVGGGAWLLLAGCVWFAARCAAPRPLRWARAVWRRLRCGPGSGACWRPWQS
jgi:hypothetical protein